MMKHSKSGMQSIRTSTLMLAISMAMAGCGGGGGGSSSSGSASGAEDSNNGGTSPQPVTCSETQYLQEGICKNKTAQSFEPLQLQRFLKGQAYQLNLKTDQDLTLSFSSESPNICDFELGELKALGVGKCTLTLTQAGISQLLPVNSTMMVDVIEAQAEEHKDLNACHAGRPSEAERQLFINTLNEIRALHNLPKVRYDQAYEDQMMQASMLLAVNEKTSHYPDRTWRCFSDIGYQGTSTSNLNFVQAYQPLASYGADTHLINWLIEKNSSSIGHRRHIVKPLNYPYTR